MSKVYLIGTGPGDDELITVKAMRKLKMCTSVVYDRLIPMNILNYLKEDCNLYYVGKEPGKHSKTQEEINKLIINLAKDGDIVGRLKGGDPYVFGRGGEEALELLKAGIKFEVIPGVTSAVSVLNYAGIPITHRGVSKGFHVFTGKSFNELNINWESLAKSNDTLVFLMGLNNLKNIKENLASHGKSLDSSCAVIMKGTSSKQKKVVGTLDDIEEKVKKAQLLSPSIIVVGDVVKLSEQLNWYEKMPLFGAKVCITRAKSNNESFKYKFKDLGAEVTLVNTIKFKNCSENLKEYEDKLSKYHHIILTSTKAVNSFFDYLIENNIDIRNIESKFYVTGKTTEKAIRQRGIVPFFVGDGSKEGIFLKLEEVAKGEENIFYPTSKKSVAVEKLKEVSNKLKLNLDTVFIYDTLKDDVAIKTQVDDVDFIVFSSPSSVINFATEYDTSFMKDKNIVVIGETTKEVASKYFNGNIYISKESTEDSLINEVIKIWRDKKGD